MIARLQGRLYVLLAVQEELQAIGASRARLEKNRNEIARVRAELVRVTGCERTAISPMRPIARARRLRADSAKTQVEGG